MKTDVRAPITVDMHGYFGTWLQLFARSYLAALSVRRHNIVSFIDRHSLGEFAGVIGILLPAQFLVVGTPDLYLDPIERMPIGIPNRPKYHSVRRWLLAISLTLCARSP